MLLSDIISDVKFGNLISVCQTSFFLSFFLSFWLCWVFVSVRGLSLVVASGGHS